VDIISAPRPALEGGKYSDAAAAGVADRHDAVFNVLNLGVLYEEGLGGTKEYAKAREWYQKAAAGDRKALAKLSQVKAITRRLRDKDDEVRRPALQELGRGWKKDPDILSSLKERAISDTKGDVRQAVVQEIARGWKEDPDTLPWLKERAISDENSDVRQAAIQELGSFE
jgi:TPR repeat protein